MSPYRKRTVEKLPPRIKYRRKTVFVEVPGDEVKVRDLLRAIVDGPDDELFKAITLAREYLDQPKP